MNFLVRMNLALGGTLVLILGAVSYVSSQLLDASARQQLLQQEGLILDGAVATREYTTEEILPLLAAALKSDFPPQSVPFYAATQHFLKVHARHPEYSYKEATLNPTNLRDRATDWESDVIQQFRNENRRQEIIGERDTPLGRAMYTARPIRVEPQCLVCHSTAQAAPATLVARYGAINGFGWQANEIIGAQVVSAPLGTATTDLHAAWRRIVVTLALLLALLLLMVNALLYALLIRPLREVTQLADALSRGETPRATFSSRGPHEVTSISRAFERLRISLEKALKRLQP